MPKHWDENEEGLLYDALRFSHSALKSLQRCHLSHTNPHAQTAIKKLHEAYHQMERVMRDPFNRLGD